MYGMFIDLNSINRVMLTAFDGKDEASDYLQTFGAKAKKAGATGGGYFDWEELERLSSEDQDIDLDKHSDEQIDAAKEAMKMVFPNGAYFGCGCPCTPPYVEDFELGKPIIPRFDLD